MAQTATPRRIAHISDIHIYNMEGVRPWHFLNKRITGGVNLLLKRSKRHRNEVVIQALEQIAQQNVDHIVVTGDLSNLALDSEFIAARKLIETHAGGPSRVSIIPGNHDYYTYAAARSQSFESFFRDWMKSDLPTESDSPYPYVKFLGQVALVGVNTSVPAPPTIASGHVGPSQRAALAKLLDHPEVQKRFILVAQHHHLQPPVHTNSRRERVRELRDHGEVLSLLLEKGAHLVLHGHNHQYGFQKVPRPSGGEPMYICEAGSTSICEASMDTFGGKYNLYDLTLNEEDHVVSGRVTTYLYRTEEETFTPWKEEPITR